MHSISPSYSGVTLKSVKSLPNLTNSGLLTRFTVKCGYRSDAAIDNNTSLSGGIISNRADWQRSCAILTSKVVSQQQETQTTGNAEITAVNGHKTLYLISIGNLPKPLSITDLSPAPMHGSRLRVAYQGVPGAYSEAAAGKAYSNCEGIPCKAPPKLLLHGPFRFPNSIRQD